MEFNELLKEYKIDELIVKASKDNTPVEFKFYGVGMEVIAVEETLGISAMAKCCPEDEFDFFTGMTIAFNRLKEEIDKGDKRYFTGRAVCTYGDICFTTGKIYDFKNGYTLDDKGNGFPERPGLRVEGLDFSRTHLFYPKFIEYKGEIDREKLRKLFNGKAVCVRSYNRDVYKFTEGAVYDFKDGHTRDDNGRKFPSIGRGVDENYFDSFHSDQFVKLVEDEK